MKYRRLPWGWTGMVLAASSTLSIANRYPPTDVTQSSSETKPRSLFPSFQLQESQNKHFRLGFAGRIQTLLMGPSDVMDTDSTPDRMPLFGKVLRPWFPSLYVGGEYDFARSRYGVTHFSTTVQCPVEPWKTKIRPNLDSIDQDDWLLSTPFSSLLSKTRRSLSVLLPSSVEVTREHELLEPNVATIWGCRWPRCRTPSINPREMDDLMIQHRKCKKSATATLSIPVHSRLRLKFRLRNRGMETQGNVEQNSNNPEDDWWIPDVCVDALGLMESKNQFWLQNQGISLTLLVRRRLDWSALGLFGQDGIDSGPTRILFQVQRRSPSSSSKVEISSFFDHPLRSASVLLEQDFVLGNF